MGALFISKTSFLPTDNKIMSQGFRVPHTLILLLAMMLAAAVVLVLAVTFGYGDDVQPKLTSSLI